MCSPRACAARIPATVRSRKTSRSNCATAPRTEGTFCRRPSPCQCARLAIAGQCLGREGSGISSRLRSGRPSRSSFHTTSVSPARTSASARSTCGRERNAPLSLSWEDSLATGGLERVELQAGRLLVRRDQVVADETGLRRLRYINVSRTTRNALLEFFRSRVFGYSFSYRLSGHERRFAEGF